MATIATSVILQRMSENIGDWISVSTTTNITTNNSIISTNLNQYDKGRDDFFNEWWVWLNTTNNATIERQISDYATATGTLTIRGAALAAESAAATIWVFRYPRSDKLKCINDTLREIQEYLFLPKDDRTLITNNWLPNAHFEDQATSGTPDGGYAFTTATGAKETTDIWGGVNAVKVTASAANGYMELSAVNHPELLDLMDTSVTLKVRALPQTATDATVQIYTKQADGTEQTGLISTTANPAGEFTLIELKDQKLNDDLVEVKIRFRVATNGQYVIYDNARLYNGYTRREYRLPLDFVKGDIRNIEIQTSGVSDDWCDDLRPQSWERLYGTSLINHNAIPYLRLPASYTSNRLIRIIGTTPFSSLDADTDTLTFDNTDRANLITAYASYLLFKRRKNPVSSSDTRKIDDISTDWLREYYRLLPLLGMTKEPAAQRLPVLW